MDLLEKFENLKSIIADYDSVAVAFSGGVDSTFLLKTAHGVLGDKAVAVTAKLCFCPERELSEAVEFCKKEKITQLFCEPDVLKTGNIAQNPPNRCYLCKNEILTQIKKSIEPYNIKYILEGSHADDDENDRPGFRAVKEHGVKSPLKDAGFTKSQIRELSKELGIPTWNKQASPCLATRFVYGETITEEKLGIVEKAERLLKDLGFSEIRVRIHGKIARIEINPNEFSKITEPEISRKIYGEFKRYGFTYATLDLRGFRSGSMSEI